MEARTEQAKLMDKHHVISKGALIQMFKWLEINYSKEDEHMRKVVKNVRAQMTTGQLKMKEIKEIFSLVRDRYYVAFPDEEERSLSPPPAAAVVISPPTSAFRRLKFNHVEFSGTVAGYRAFRMGLDLAA